MKTTNKSFLEYMTGTDNYALFCACMAFAIIACTIKMYREVDKGVKYNPLSAEKFSVKYWILDGNLARVIVGFFSMLLSIRFMDYGISASPLGKIEVINNENTKLLLSVGIGLGQDWLLNKFRQWGWFGSAN